MSGIILCVAEKPSVAKEVAKILSENKYKVVQTASKYNPCYMFNIGFHNKNYKVMFTSVLGHLKTYAFPEELSNWDTTPLEKLYEVELERKILGNSTNIYESLKELGKQSEKVILWLDCDREGEAIAFEVLDTIIEENPTVEYFRAKFSAVTPDDVWNAMNNLGPLNKNLALAVEARQEIDLRIGASFTRFQTLNFSNLLDNKSQLLSYGPCQFPTLGFVVERWKEANEFVPENYWSLNLIEKFTINKKKINVKFNWKKERVYNKEECEAIYKRLSECENGVIESAEEELKIK